ncbi:MAG TPA: carboxylating nicotinate-nucleotide diphosphorylase [Chthoniobacteraceae bacterium]|nr:carboxylating nicotinate-nucleotide diphosphorylase [Chthoniobacteraceae bacterium]
MKLQSQDQEAIEATVARALAEDVGPGDVTCAYFVTADQRCRATIVAREKGVAAGVEVAETTFRQVDPTLEITLQRHSGDPFSPGDPILTVSGRVATILTAERVALNFLQRLSGVATLTRRFVDLAAPFGAKVLDTRKTTPGLRLLEKRAVAAGGGVNHRFGLYDMVMVKDNHLAAESDLAFLQAAIDRLRAERPGVRVELETDTLAQVRDFLTLRGVDVILLDNMTNAEMREAVALGKKRVLFEASGGVNLATIGGIAATGVDYISVGALTHSARAIDFSLELTR